eukprot:3583172-Rhodomonas_salina.1
MEHMDSEASIADDEKSGGFMSAFQGCISSVRSFSVQTQLHKLKERFRFRRAKRPAKKILIHNPATRVKVKNKRVNFRLPKSRQHHTFEPFEPDSLVLRRWAHFMVIPLSYEVWAWPFRLAFGEAEFNAAVTADIVFDIIFFADMLRKCASVIPAGTYPDQDEPIKSFASITRHYLGSREFLRDITSMVVYYTLIIIDFRSNQLNLWIFWAGTLPRIAFRAQVLSAALARDTKSRILLQRLYASQLY